MNSKLDQVDETPQMGELRSAALTRETEFSSDLTELIVALEHEAYANRKRVKLWTRFVIGICSAVFLLFLTLLIAAAVTKSIRAFEPGWIFGFFGLIGPAALITLSSRRHKVLAAKVAECDDLRAIGPLIGSLNIEGHQVQASVSEAVTRMLSRMDSDSAGQLTGDQVGMLNYQLRRAATDPLVTGKGSGFVFVIARRHKAWQERMHKLLLAIMHAAPLFGNRETAKPLEKLARIRGGSPRHQELSAAANSALAELRERLEVRDSEARLLRPAGDAGPDGLLRPASGTGNSSADLLLRSSSENG